MVSVSRRLVFLTAAALLTASGIFTLGIQAERATQTAPSSTISAAVLKALQWRSVGPPRAGRTIAASGVKGRPKEAYSGQTGRRSVEDGRRRRDVGAGDGRARSTAHRSARSPSRSPIPTSSSSAWASRASAATSSRATASTSRPTPARRGRTSASRTRRRSRKIRIHPTNPDIVFVASFGKYGVPSDERGIFKSTDGGKTWRKVLFRDNKTGARRHRDRSAQSQRDVRGAVGGVPRRVLDVERRSGQRPVQVDRRRRDVDRDHPQAGAADDGVDRQDRRRGVGRGLRTASTRSSRTRTAASSAPTTPARRGSW